MKKAVMIALALVMMLSGCSVDEEATVVEPEEQETPAPVEVLGFLDDLDYSPEQIAGMREILTNVGITKITDVEVGKVVYGMQSITGLAYTDGGSSTPKEVQVRVNIENGVVYMVSIYCPSYGTSKQTPYLSGLEDRRADLYYDGYLKKIDWDSKSVVGYGEKEEQ